MALLSRERERPCLEPKQGSGRLRVETVVLGAWRVTVGA